MIFFNSQPYANFSLFICSLGSVLYVIILGIVSIAIGAISIENSWIILASACFSFLINIICISCLILKNESNATRHNISCY